MSKLFPMFKKKGKGKDDDTNEEEPKRKGKTERVREAFAGSPLSPSKSGKQKKKVKPVKEKKAVNGNVSCHMAEEAVIHQVEDFYVDDDGTVKLGGLQEDQSFVDEVLSSVEESFSQEHDRSFGAFDKDYCGDTVEKYCIKRGNEQADGEMILKDDETEVFSGYDQPGDRSSQGSLEVNSRPLVEEKDQDFFVTIIGHGQEVENECGEIEPSVQDSGCLEMYSDQQKDFEGVENLKEDQQSIEMVVDDNLQATGVGNHCISSDNEEIDIGSISEEKTSYLSACEKASHLEDDENMENVNTDNEAEDLLEESIGRCEKQASENVTSSQDSDDDFDSAQEDWDEDDRGKPQTLEPSLPSPCLVQEARNSALVDNESADQDGCLRKRISSVYEDATGFVQLDSSLGGESSDFEESRKVRRVSGSEKLVRKLSNISAASSDVFNEELDDLLDEELDRLSEEEEAPLDNSVSKQGDDVEDCVDRCAEKSVNIENAAGNLADLSSAQDDSKIQGNVKQKSDNLVIENHNKDNPTCVMDVNQQQTSTESGDKTSDISMKKGSLSGNRLSTSDENSDHIKDSGYYSLPVSPNPGAIIRASGEEERGAKVVDVSFADSEEDGMITPPSEASTVEANSENSRETVNSVEENINSVVVSETDTPNQCSNECEKLPEKVSTVVNTSSEASNSQQALSRPKQGGNLKVIIPSGGEKNKDEGVTSPNCGSPTKFRHKSPLKEAEEAFSPDPIGERFLEQAVLLGHDEAEARLAQRRAARAEARELRLRELEKQQQDQENEEEKQFAPSFAEPSPRATVAGRTTVGRTAVLNSSRRSSEDSTTDEAALPANIRELRTELKELDEKFRKAMITNAQLDNEKSTLTYEVELIKDKYTELEETHTQLNKEHRRKCTEYEQLRKVSTKLQEEVKILRGMLQERDQLIQEYGLIVVGEEEENGEVPPDPDEFDDMDDLTPRKIAVKKVLLSQEAAELLGKGAAKGSLDVRLKKFGEEKNDLEDEVRRLKLELEEERNKNRRRENGLDYEKAKEQSKALNEYKFRVQKAEAEVLTLQANVARLDALSTRYKTQSEELEKSEEELKLERRKLQRELRDAQSRLEELETTNNHLIRRFDKIKNARSTLLKDLSQDPA